MARSNYSRTSGPSSALSKEVYIARDDDWEEPEGAFDDDGTGWDEPDEEVYYDEEEEEQVIAEVLVSDVPEEAYWDDSSLANCWLAALSDFKVSCRLGSMGPKRLTKSGVKQYQHPGNFAPLREAPRTAEQKHTFAPLCVPSPLLCLSALPTLLTPQLVWPSNRPPAETPRHRRQPREETQKQVSQVPLRQTRRRQQTTEAYGRDIGICLR